MLRSWIVFPQPEQRCSRFGTGTRIFTLWSRLAAWTSTLLNGFLMLAWRYALVGYLDEAIKSKALKSDLTVDELRAALETEAERDWNVFVGPSVPKKRVIDDSLYKTFGENPLVGRDGQRMQWVGRLDSLPGA